MKRTFGKLRALFILGIVLILSQSNVIYADGFEKSNELINIENRFGNTVSFNINRDLSSLIQLDELKKIANDHPEAGLITIHNIVENHNSDSQVAPQSSPIIINPPPRNVTKKVTHYNVHHKTQFITSVARGSEKVIDKSFTAKSSVSGSLSVVDLSLDAGVTYSIKQTYTGPPRGSKYNTTKYYIKWEANKGTYSAEVFSHADFGKWVKTSGTFTEVTRGIEYSVDTNA